MAPEVMNFQNHTVAVDYFAMGVICYELMMGVRPYVGESRNEIKEKILARQIVIKSHEIPSGWSKEAADFINNLIQRKPSSRLGFKGINQIKQHKWFNHFSWKDLYNMRIESPYIPSYEDNFDSNYCEREDNISQQEQELLNKIKSSEQYKTIFKNFLFFNMYDERSNSQKTFINPHKKYEEKQAYSSPQKLKSTIPQLSDEAKETNKFNLFSPRNNKIKHHI